jgi:hypothetical protein
MVELATETILLLMVASFAAGFIDSIAGGGGAHHRTGIAAGWPVTYRCARHQQARRHVRQRVGHDHLCIQGTCRPEEAIAERCSVGDRGGLGALLATVVPGEWMRALLPVLLVAIAVYFAFKPNMDDIDHQRISPALFGFTMVPAIGLYDGLFGPGTGSFFMLAFVSLLGYGVLKATAHTKLLNFGSNVGSIIVSVLAGAVVWKVGLLMGSRQFGLARVWEQALQCASAPS